MKKLVDAAIAVARNAYAPYSNFPVGAALLAADGTIYTGCNVENASFPATICAERAALVKAISEGQREFTSIVVVTRSGGSPCGICRQMLYEFAPDLNVIVATLDGDVLYEVLLHDMLTHGFGPKELAPMEP
jgi:cytidine deaminase